MDKEQLHALLKFDALGEAEELTGVSIHDKDPTNPSILLGADLMVLNSQAKQEELLRRGDTLFTNDLDRYQGIIERVGFEKVYQSEGFKDCEDEYPDYLFVYARNDGLLLVFDTYRGVHVNGGNLYYNWRPNDPEEYLKYISSGGFSGDVWVGNHDCREALMFNIGLLRDNGEFLSPWIKRPDPLWFVYREERKRLGSSFESFSHYDRVTKERIEQMPEWVRTMLGPECV